MNSRQYHDESLRRYQQKLDNMTPVEFAQEGLRHLKMSFAVAIVISVICGVVLWKTDDPVPAAPMVILGFVLFALPFMVLEWFVLKRAARGEKS